MVFFFLPISIENFITSPEIFHLKYQMSTGSDILNRKKISYVQQKTILCFKPLYFSPYTL